MKKFWKSKTGGIKMWKNLFKKKEKRKEEEENEEDEDIIVGTSFAR